MGTPNERLGCAYCFKTLDPLDRQQDLHTFVRCSREENACGSLYHQLCWDASGRCHCCDGEKATVVEIITPSPLQVVRKTKALPIKPSKVHRKEDLRVLTGLILITFSLIGVLGYYLIYPKREIPKEPPYTAPVRPPERASGFATAESAPQTKPSALQGANPPSSRPVPAHEVRISYRSEATPYIEHMINHARDTEKVLSARNEIEKLRKPERGERKRARKLNDEALDLMRQARDMEAVPLFEEAHRLDPLDVEIVNNLASAYFNTSSASNDYSKAKNMLVETLKIKPGRNIAWANLGRTFAMEGDEYAATNCYINYYRFSEDREKALQRLTDSVNEPHPVLSKALANAYQAVSSATAFTR